MEIFLNHENPFPILTRSQLLLAFVPVRTNMTKKTAMENFSLFGLLSKEKRFCALRLVKWEEAEDRQQTNG
jgi:hypothetical protein